MHHPPGLCLPQQFHELLAQLPCWLEAAIGLKIQEVRSVYRPGYMPGYRINGFHFPTVAFRRTCINDGKGGPFEDCHDCVDIHRWHMRHCLRPRPTTERGI